MLAFVVMVVLFTFFASKKQEDKGKNVRNFFIRLYHEGCRGNFLIYADALMQRNFFKRGEVATLEFDVNNPSKDDWKVVFYLAPFDKPSIRFKVGGGLAKAERATRINLEVGTSSLEPALYLIVAEIEGQGEFTANTEPFRLTNLETYPWLLAIPDEKVAWSSPKDGLLELRVPEGLGVNIHFIKPSYLEERDLDMIAYAGFPTGPNGLLLEQR